MTGSRALFVTYTILTLSASAIYQQTSKAEPESPPLIPVYSFKVLSFPSADKVTTLANLAQPERVTFTPDSAQSAVNMLLKAVTEKCGWPDPAILVWIAKKQGNEQLRANTGTFDNLPTGHVSVIFPSCVYLSPSEATIKAAKSGETSDLIPSDSVREFVSKNAQNISDSIWALPVEQRLGLVQGRDFLVNVEPGLKETTSISQTSNAQEAIDIASGVIRGTISLATYEQRRNALFSRIVSETTRALKDPQKRSAISRTSIQHFGEQKISFISGTTADELRDQLKDAFEIIDDTPKEFLEYDPNNPASIAAAKECESGLGNAASSRTWPVPVHRIIDAIERNHFQRVKRTGSVEDETPVLVADTGYPELLLEQIGSHWDEVAANRDYYFPDSLWFTVQDKLGGRKDKLGADVTKDELSYNVEPPDADKYAAAHHGMWVASLVLGGFDLGFFRSNEVLPIRVHFAKLLTLKSDGSKYIIPREAIARAVQYAFQHKIQIVNLSVSTNRELSQLKGLLEGAKEAKNLLVVSAAGEDAVDLRSEGRWPARYGGDPGHAPIGTTFITVGAIRADGQPYSRSNRGGEYVDLLAPGCSLLVPEITISDKKMRMDVRPRSGTSFSAPIVTFVSALLMSEQLTPAQVKTRLAVSATHNPDLTEYAVRGSVLDPVAALGVYHDFVELADGREIRGYLTDDTMNAPPIDTCDKSDGGLINVNAILSVDQVQAASTQESTLSFYVTPDLDTRVPYRVIPCKNKDAEFAKDVIWKMRRLESSEVVQFSLKDVKRFIRRTFTDNPNPSVGNGGDSRNSARAAFR